jgi:hypothetical protein
MADFSWYTGHTLSPAAGSKKSRPGFSYSVLLPVD